MCLLELDLQHSIKLRRPGTHNLQSFFLNHFLPMSDGPFNATHIEHHQDVIADKINASVLVWKRHLVRDDSAFFVHRSGCVVQNLLGSSIVPVVEDATEVIDRCVLDGLRSEEVVDHRFNACAGEDSLSFRYVLIQVLKDETSFVVREPSLESLQVVANVPTNIDDERLVGLDGAEKRRENVFGRPDVEPVTHHSLAAATEVRDEVSEHFRLVTEQFSKRHTICECRNWCLAF
jgi:hypothetical protein